MALHAEAARRRRGELIGGNGRALADASDLWMRSQGIACPDRIVAMLVPGVVRRAGREGEAQALR
ncbi:MAG TPA: hypothetical protein VFA98_05655 [Thermoanaerobaculia bacterium]|jgi:hypothetical protein|nr:hypothetical protein [Thermoanaerobaculia bacterium]